jgi:heavy metal sensor kinase
MSGSAVRYVDRLPDWMRSIRIRYAVMYSAVLFGLAALLVGGLYLGLSMKLRSAPVDPQISFPVQVRMPNGQVSQVRVDAYGASEFRAKINANTLEQLRDFSFIALGVLFVASLGIGWVIAGQVLAPIQRITEVARDIQATDLARRIQLQGPDDELKQLADTFDQMLERLEGAFDAQQRFVADASHELRNPLAVIRTNIDVALADQRLGADDLRQTATVVKRASDRMARLVDDLLLIARREVPGERSDLVDLAAVMSEEADEFAAAAKRKGVALELSIQSGLVVSGDRDALKRAVANLLENAVRYAKDGGRVRLRSGRERSWAWISVTDDGQGIAPDLHERVFDRFFRIDKSRTRSEGGSGLGLAIVRQIARAHGGEVQLRSTPGEGATFVIWLPTTGPGQSPASATPPATVPTTA